MDQPYQECRVPGGCLPLYVSRGINLSHALYEQLIVLTVALLSGSAAFSQIHQTERGAYWECETGIMAYTIQAG